MWEAIREFDVAISTLDQLLAGMQPAAPFFKPSTTSTAGIWQSFWYVAGIPAAGSGPATTVSALLDSTTTGAFPLTNPSGGRLSYVGRADGVSNQTGRLMVYDRLAHYGLTATSAATVNMVSPVSVSGQRSGAGELWLETANTGAASTKTFTVSYTNQAGTTGRTTASISIAASPPTYGMFRLPFQSGDTGALSVASATIGSAALQSSGTANVVILRQLLNLPVSLANVGTLIDGITAGLQRVYDSSCIAFAWLPTTTSTGDVQGSLAYTQG